MEERVQKIIANAGYCSRRKAEELIKDGKVSVNKKIISLGDKADLKKDKIMVNGKQIKKRSHQYFLLNKPKNYLTALSDDFGKRTIMDLIVKNGIKERVIPIGRLDFTTEGLLLLTTDGDFANKVMHPRYEVKKTYEVIIDRPLEENHKTFMEKGTKIMDKKTYPAIVKFSDKSRTRVEVTIHEGRNRIIRRMFKKFGYNILSLKRTRINDIGMGKLKLGKIRKLSEPEIQALLPKKSL